MFNVAYWEKMWAISRTKTILIFESDHPGMENPQWLRTFSLLGTKNKNKITVF